jgi:hypothetical protein
MTPPISRRQLHPEGSRTDAALSAEALTLLREESKTLVAHLDDLSRSEIPAYRTRYQGFAHHVIGLWKVIDASRNSPDAQVGAIGEPVADCEPKPICYLRMLHGKPDWAEDCVGGEHDVIDSYETEDGYSSMPLYSAAHVFEITLLLRRQCAQLQGELARLRSEAVKQEEEWQEVCRENDQLRDQLAALQAQGKNANDVNDVEKSSITTSDRPTSQSDGKRQVAIIGDCAEVIWLQGGPCQIPPGTKLYAAAIAQERQQVTK